RVRLDRNDVRLAALEGGGHRSASRRLGAGEARHGAAAGGAVDQLQVEQLAGGLVVLDELAAAGDGDDDLVRQPPAQLLGGLVGERLRALAVEGAHVDVAEGPGEDVDQLAAETVDVVVVAVDA